MSIEFVAGNLFTYPGLDAWAHGCNCQGVMGAGIAVQFKKRFPEMFREYARKCRNQEFRPGDCFTWVESPLTIFNLATQESFEARLDWIEQSLYGMIRKAEDLEIMAIGIPAIGAGLGGLEWTDVKPVLETVGNSFIARIVCFETFVP